MGTSADRLRRVQSHFLGCAVALGFAGTLAGQPGPVRGGALPEPLPLLPPDNWWNVDVSLAPMDPGSSGYIGFINGAPNINPTLHPDFGGDAFPSPAIYGMVYVTVPGDQSLEPVAFDYADQSDPGAPGRPAGYPIPVEARTGAKWIEGGYPGNSAEPGDKHMLIVDRDQRLLFETWNTRCEPEGAAYCSWRAGSGAVFSLDSSQRRPEGWTSADAAGLAILPGLVRWDEVNGPEPIRHALRVTVDRTRGYVFPASHDASTSTSTDALPLGARLRLRSGVVVSSPDPGVQKVVLAMKTYGLIVADNGHDLYVQGTYDTRWDNGVLNPALGQVRASDFDVILLGWRPVPTAGTGQLMFNTLSPCRILDTREAPGAWGGPVLEPGAQRVFRAHGRCGIPSSAEALSVNVTVVGPSTDGDLRFFPGDAESPLASLINYRANQVRANNAFVRLSSSGTGTFTVQNDSPSGTAHVVVDVNGFFQPE